MRFYSVYKFIFLVCKPLLKYILNYRVKKGKEDPNRYIEKMGIPSKQRPAGKIIWIHAVSVGESVSTLSLINQLEKNGYTVLLTTSTLSSAKLMEKRLPETVIHQYYPYDVNKWVKRFVAHWQPEIAIMIESELWFNMLEELKRNNIKVLLFNARMSQSTIKRWSFMPFIAKELFSYCAYISTQTHYYKNIIQRFAKCKVETFGNLKNTAPPLPFDNNQLDLLKQDIGNRNMWVAVSTHKQDESFIEPILGRIYNNHKNLLTIIIPRHPERLDELLTKFKDYKISIRSRREKITKDTQIYIVDTIGEVGLFLSLTNICFVGGACGGGYGGHNPLEPAKLNNAIIQGFDTSNFAEITMQLSNNNGHIIVNDSEELYTNLDNLISDKKLVKKYSDNAHKVISLQNTVIEKLVEKVEEYI
ncbi:MAG: glycosyltransferase N-terminal domain-containing protein [Alphaproteobacteria bacterium]|nr:glycosyltransferase N-terminal domain-containing protein [Alphaproteobacteria bacterium]